MKISNSKQELARIISENGGWREGKFAAQDKTSARIDFYKEKPWINGGQSNWNGDYIVKHKMYATEAISNWHQTILSRAEFFHLYPAPDADGWIEWNGGAANPVEFGVLVDVKLANGEVLNRVSANSGAEWRHCCGDTNIIAYRLHKPEQVSATEKLSDAAVSSAKDALMSDSIEGLARKPTIEQLVADYRNLLDFAQRKQQEADDAKADANEALRKLEIAGEAIGLIVTPITSKKEDELVIQVKVGDEVECVESNIKRDKYNGMVGRLRTIDESDTSTPYLVDFGGNEKIWCHEVKFISRQ